MLYVYLQCVGSSLQIHKGDSKHKLLTFDELHSDVLFVALKALIQHNILLCHIHCKYSNRIYFRKQYLLRQQ